MQSTDLQPQPPTLGARIKDMTGQRFGRLEVLGYAGVNQHHAALWTCRCGGPECQGREVTVVGCDLRKGNTRSCGCLIREGMSGRNRVHGLSGHPLYTVWRSMIGRCYRPGHKAFARYGGRGIAVCPQWRHSFEEFHRDVIKGYGRGLQLDRIDNDGNYEPGNVRWATRSENSRNTRHNRVIEFGGKSRCLTEWAEILGLSAHTLNSRLRSGWPVDRALTEGVDPARMAAHLKTNPLPRQAVASA